MEIELIVGNLDEVSGHICHLRNLILNLMGKDD